MKTLKGIVNTGDKTANFLFSKKIELENREFTPFKQTKKLTKQKIKALREAYGSSPFKLNQNVFHKPRKPEKKPKKIEAQPLIGNRLRDLFRFKNLKDTAQAFNTSEANLNNLNSGKAGEGLSNSFRCVIAFAKEHPVRKRKKILAKINFDETFSRP